MNGIDIYEDLDWFDEIFGDLDLTMLHSGEKHRVFVYGTLMTGMRNHHRMERDGVKLISDQAITTRSNSIRMYTRVTQSGYPAPIAIKTPDIEDDDFMPGDPHFDDQIQGEVYEVNNSILIYLDQLEGHPEVYRRERIRVAFNNASAQVIASLWMYLYTGEPTNNLDHIVRTGSHDVTYKWEGEQQ